MSIPPGRPFGQLEFTIVVCNLSTGPTLVSMFSGEWLSNSLYVSISVGRTREKN
jgi:hypothetical protein